LLREFLRRPAARRILDQAREDLERLQAIDVVADESCDAVWNTGVSHGKGLRRLMVAVARNTVGESGVRQSN
jgi:hypothetical protein